MAFYLSPLVAVREVDLSTTIPAVATSIGVSVLRDTYRGPEKKQTFITSEQELIDVFGKPTNTANCYRDVLSAAGYLKYGNKLYCTRTLSPTATFAGTRLTSAGEGLAYSSAYQLSDLASEDPDDFALDIAVNDPSQPMWLIASSRGSWGNNIRVATCTKADYDQIQLGNTPSSWTTAITATDSTYTVFGDVDVSMEDSKDFLVVVEEMEQGEDVWTQQEFFLVSTKETAVDDQGVSKYVETVINQQSKYIRVVLHNDQVNENWTTSTDAYVQFSGGVTGEGAGSAEDIEAYNLYQNPEEIDVNILIDSAKPLAVKRQMITICESRKDCMAVLDCDYSLVVNNSGNETTDLRNWRRGTGSYITDNLNENTSYAAVYGNWIEVYDLYNRKYRWIPVSGHVAGIYARTDDVRDPWWAPAGLNRAILTNVRRLAWNPSLGDRDILYKNGINPIVAFAGQGKVIWGQKTLLDKSSAFNRINVRRLYITLEKAIATAAKYFVFEPNDSISRTQLTNMIVPFLRDVKARRGIYEFKVICDETNNTPERIDRNELWCDILIKPTRTAEFIILTFAALRTGMSFSEAAAAV